jgi:hypothetical protein
MNFVKQSIKVASPMNPLTSGNLVISNSTLSPGSEAIMEAKRCRLLAAPFLCLQIKQERR